MGNASKCPPTTSHDPEKIDLASSRPSDRTFSLLDIPDEILLEIFSYISEDIRSKFSNATGIQSVRLTCRRFCATSTHLLVRCAHVGLDPTSLSRLDKISRHPIINKGVRHVRVNLRFYDTALSWSIIHFAQQRSQQVRQVQSRQLSHARHPGRGVVQTAISTTGHERNRLFRKLIRFLDNFRVETPCLADDRPTLAILTRAYEEYRKCHHAMKKMLRDGSFHAGVAGSLARMPLATAMSFTDENTTYHSEEEAIIAAIQSDSGLMNFLKAPLSWAQGEDSLIRSLDSLPARLLWTLPIAVHKAGTALSSLDFHVFRRYRRSTPSFSFLEMNPDARLNFIQMSESLKHIGFLPGESRGLHDQRFDPGDLEKLVVFLTMLLSGSPIETVALDLRMFTDNESDRTQRLGRILLTSQWTSLRSMVLDGLVFNLDEMQVFLHCVGARHGLERLVLRSPYLARGTWAELLDDMRASFRPATCGRQPYLEFHNPRGAECDEPGTLEIQKIFRTPTGEPRPAEWASMPLAVSYVLGLHDVNPIRTLTPAA